MAFKAACTVLVTQSVCDEGMDLLSAFPTFVPAVRYSRWWTLPWCGRGGVSGDEALRRGVICSHFRAGQHLHGVQAGDGLTGARFSERQYGTDFVPYGLGLCLGDHQAVEATGDMGQVVLVGAVAVSKHLIGEVQPVAGGKLGCAMTVPVVAMNCSRQFSQSQPTTGPRWQARSIPGSGFTFGVVYSEEGAFDQFLDDGSGPFDDPPKHHAGHGIHAAGVVELARGCGARDIGFAGSLRSLQVTQECSVAL